MSELERRVWRGGDLLVGNVMRHASPTEVLFAKPDTSDCHIRYTIVGKQYLCVTGDLGCAVYQWSRELTFEWLGGLSLDYFAAKCRASEEGWRFQDWSAEHCRERFRDRCEANVDDGYGEIPQEIINLANEAAEDEHSWRTFCDQELRDHWDDLDGFWDMGMVTSLRCVCHWMGLQKIGELVRKPEGT